MIKFFTSKARAFTVFIFALAYMSIFAISTLLVANIAKDEGTLILSILFMLAAIPFHWFGKKHPSLYLASIVLNAIATGFSVSAYYINIEIIPNITHAIAAMLPSVAILLIVYLMLQVFSKTKKVTVTVACILNAILTAGLMALWIMDGNTIFSLGFFCSLISFFFLCVFGITVNHNERSVLRDISFGGFGSFIIVTVVVIFILSEGDVLEAFDIPDLGSGNKKSKDNRIPK